jgi:hypothetical protein
MTAGERDDSSSAMLGKMRAALGCQRDQRALATDELPIVRFFPYRQARTGGTPRLHDFRIGPRLGSKRFEKIEDQRFNWVAHRTLDTHLRPGQDILRAAQWHQLVLGLQICPVPIALQTRSKPVARPDVSGWSVVIAHAANAATGAPPADEAVALPALTDPLDFGLDRRLQFFILREAGCLVARHRSDPDGERCAPEDYAPTNELAGAKLFADDAPPTLAFHLGPSAQARTVRLRWLELTAEQGCGMPRCARRHPP